MYPKKMRLLTRGKKEYFGFDNPDFIIICEKAVRKIFDSNKTIYHAFIPSIIDGEIFIKMDFEIVTQFQMQ